MKRKTHYIILLALLGILLSQSGLQAAAPERKKLPESTFSNIADSIASYLQDKADVKVRLSINSVTQEKKTLNIDLNYALEEYPLRKADIDRIYEIAHENIVYEYAQYKINLTCDGRAIGEFSSRFYSEGKPRYKHEKSKTRWIRPVDQEYKISKGLENNQIALWSSHGYYYEDEMERWEWQRARVLQTVEDRFTKSIVLPYLVPMLENAGAQVLMPCERDPQPTEILADTHSDFFKRTPLKKKIEYSWGPDFPKSGFYAVYVRYRKVMKNKSTSEVEYEIRHSAGTQKLEVNENIGENTWLYLGSYHFDKGSDGQGLKIINPCTSQIEVKFGGGIGESGMPRFMEGSRYWLKWAGFPESVYHSDEADKDYKDDYKSRGLWVNELLRRGIPVDLALGIHSDAGTEDGDKTRGTLAIYSSESKGKTSYPDGRPRFSSRELADILQTEIVNDIRANHDENWNRRGMWDKRYFEAHLPNVNAALIELLSHQNFADMLYGHDPNFKFTVSRAIYKGILKYLSYRDKTDYVIQPLPVKNFSLNLSDNAKRPNDVHLSWSAQLDPLEKSAKPTEYLIYVRKNRVRQSADQGYPDLGEFEFLKSTRSTDITFSQKPGIVYSYKVIAVNAGGCSFPSEILSACISTSAKSFSQSSRKALVVNGFQRISAPTYISSRDTSVLGFDNTLDSGVPYVQDYSYIGPQHDFYRSKEWVNDDESGYGASALSYPYVSVAGNTFDFTVNHAIALAQCGYSVASTSIDALLRGDNDGVRYGVIDLMMGKQVTTRAGVGTATQIRYEVFPLPLREKIEKLIASGRNLIISGSYITTDAWDNIYPEPVKHSRARDLSALKSTLEELEKNLSGILNSTLEDSRKFYDQVTAEGQKLYDYSPKNMEKLAQNLGAQIASLKAIEDGISDNAKLIRKVEQQHSFKALYQAFIKTNFQIAHLTKRGTFTGQVSLSVPEKQTFPDAENPENMRNSETFHMEYSAQNQPVKYEFYMSPNPWRYSVESPCGFLPLNQKATILMRYRDTGVPAVISQRIGKHHITVAGFPIEALKSQQQMNSLMEEITSSWK